MGAIPGTAHSRAGARVRGWAAGVAEDPTLVVLGVVVLAGAGVGVVNGTLVGALNVSPFMATLATLAAARGAALLLAGDSGVAVGNGTVSWFGEGRVRAVTYVLAGTAAGIGAVITMGRLGSAQPLAGSGLEFSAITAAVIGGTKLSGGEGGIAGTVLGAVLVGVISSGLSFLPVAQGTNYLVTGGLILIAVLLHRPDLAPALRGAPRTPGAGLRSP